MRCPTLNELSPPPLGKTGWPWTEESPQLPDTVPALSMVEGANGSSWPRVSIVTPSYNQVQFIEETIRSVLLQGYPDLEYIIIDGGSTDGSVDIIRKYEPWLAHWVSEPDEGQSHAINKGFERATGEIVAWLNSDDTYEPSAVANGVVNLLKNPTCPLVYGDCNVIEENGHIVGKFTGVEYSWSALLLGTTFPQPTVFMRKEAVDAVGGLDTSLDYIIDYELWLRLGAKYDSLEYMPGTWANFRVCQGTKSTTHPYRFAEEHLQILERYTTGRYSVSLALKDEAYRRWHLRAGIASIRAGAPERAGEHLARTFADGRHPFPHLERLVGFLLRAVSNVSGVPDEVDRSDEYLADFFMAMPNEPIKRNLQGHAAMVRAFQAHVAGNQADVFRFGLTALSKSRHTWSNRGLLVITARALTKRCLAVVSRENDRRSG